MSAQYLLTSIFFFLLDFYFNFSSQAFLKQSITWVFGCFFSITLNNRFASTLTSLQSTLPSPDTDTVTQKIKVGKVASKCVFVKVSLMVPSL